MRKTPYPSRLEPRLKTAILRLELMSQAELQQAIQRLRRGDPFLWPEFLAFGPGSLVGPWNPPDVEGLTHWMVRRANHYGRPLGANLEGATSERGSVEFQSGSHRERHSWNRMGLAYRAVEKAFKTIRASADLQLGLERLEPYGEVFQWVVIRDADQDDFTEHVRGEREWHSQLSRSYQFFSEAKRRGDGQGQQEFARRGSMAGEYMRRCGGDFSHHTMQVVEMYEYLGQPKAAARWRTYTYQHQRGLV